MKQLVFIDDSGDPGFVPGISSANLIMAAVVFTNPMEATKLNNEISNLRKSLGWRDNHEFKFRKATKETKIRFLKTVDRYDFCIYAVYVNKIRSLNTSRAINKEKLYNWTTKELLKIIPLDNAYIKIDGRASKEYRLQVVPYLRKEINTDYRKIKEIKAQDSTKDNLIQLADIIAGSLNRSLQPEKTDSKTYMRIIKNKITKLEPLSIE